MRSYLLASIWLASVSSLHAQTSSLVVTAEAQHGKEPPELHREDVTVHQGKDRLRASELVPLRGDRAGLQLYLLIDDGANSTLALQFGELRKFMQRQPASAKIGVGYLRNGSVMKVQELTADHEQAAKSLRLPIGSPGISSSPYLALSELIKKWPDTPDRREVLMVTSGIDLYNGPGPENPYLQSAIHDAQRAGVIVYSIYYGSEGHLGHSFWQLTWGQNYLSELSDETGGEAYWQGNNNPVSFAPYLEDLGRKLGQQYRLTFEPKTGKKSGLEAVTLSTEVPHVEFLSANRIWVALP